jgi:uncharacterized protein (DUF2384 family)
MTVNESGYCWGTALPCKINRSISSSAFGNSLRAPAVELFNGDVPEAVAWLRRPRRALAGHTPLAYSGTELGAREVENLIGQLEYGVFP